jgi:hypothetical protein
MLIRSSAITSRSNLMMDRPLPTWPNKSEPIELTGDTERCVTGKCGSTHSKHRFWLPIPVQGPINPTGHDLLVVMINPNCPDEGDAVTLSNTTWFAEEIGARSGCIVNLLSRRCGKRLELQEDAQAPHNLDVLETAVGLATLILLAWGPTQVSRRAMKQRIRAEAKLRNALKARPEVLVVSVGRSCLHPGSRPGETWVGKARTELRYVS